MALFDLTTAEIIKKYHLWAEKKFGQNFIINQSLTKKIVSNFDGIEEFHIIEIGPGPLALTREILAKEPKKITLLELDQKFSDLFNDLATEYQEKIEIKFIDALKIDFATYEDKLAIISNLPYNISTPFLVNVCRTANIKQMLLMFQKEVAERIIAKPNSKNYGRLSVLAQSYYDINKVLNVAPTAFVPAPKVNSCVLHFKYNNKITNNITHDKLEKLTAILFSKRRKKIGTTLKSYNLKDLDLDLNLRAEQLNLAQFHQLAKIIS
ncbi:MAG: 16S rRNA (adenine(1518)-N(6)/adenine(1519)-N(6))-dimethyltransferase RsmA [Rickettsiales bacterium]